MNPTIAEAFAALTYLRSPKGIADHWAYLQVIVNEVSPAFRSGNFDISIPATAAGFRRAADVLDSMRARVQ